MSTGLSPALRSLEFFLELLPRTAVSVMIHPAGDLVMLNPTEKKFKSNGIDPQLLVFPMSANLNKGWYYLEAILSLPNRENSAQLYVDYGNGFHQATVIPIPVNRRGLVREVIYFSADVKALRWDPMESKGEFTQREFLLHKITSLESFYRRAWRVSFDIWRLRKKPENLRFGINTKLAIKNFDEAYKKTVSLRRTSVGQLDNYAEWINRYDTINDATRARMRNQIDLMQRKPLISVLMPVYNPNPEWLKQAIESVRSQIYSNWELCIADDLSTNVTIKPILEHYIRTDSRVKVIFRKENGHISKASNSALELVSGDWVALLDHDDLLSEHALFCVADAINKNDNIQLIYSDEDKIDEYGQRFGPYFKCDWNQDLFYSHNMFSHLGVYKTILVKQVGGFSVGLEGSQDYDLALRCIEQVEQENIYHIPRVLYHWRMHAESTAQSADAKPYAMVAGEKAINQHFERIGVQAKAKLIPYGYRVRYCLPESPPLVTLIIPTRNGLSLIKQCVESIIAKTKYTNYEILVVDNGSDDVDTLKYLEKLTLNKKIKVIQDDGPFNYSAINNRAVKRANGEIVGLVNNDIEVISPDWLDEMVSHALRPDVGCVGAKLLYPNDTIQHAGILLGVTGVACHPHRNFTRNAHGYFSRANLIQEISAVTAACLVVRKSTYELVGGLDEINLKVAFNDVDFCIRVANAGFKNIWTPYAELYHHESATRGQEDNPDKLARFNKELQFMMKHRITKPDPAYSPNLTIYGEDFSLAWPPRVELL